MAKKDKEEKKEEKELTANDILASVVKDCSASIDNDKIPKDYKISFGSLILDRELGGIGPGLHRFIGANEGGKTSEALLVMKNFFETVPNSRGIYFKAEGKLPREVIERSGLVFVRKVEDWKDGTCFIVETNLTTTVETTMKRLVLNNIEDKRWFFILDSVDGLNTPDEIEKDIKKANKSDENTNVMPAGAAKFCATLLKRINNRLSLEGHMAIFISQDRSTISMQWTKKEQQQGNSKNGHAIQHYANWVLQFGSKTQEDLIKPNAKEKATPSNPIVGHFAKVIIVKSPNETSGLTLEYPIKRGRTGGKSIWIEREIATILQEDKYYSGSNWLTIEPNFSDELTKAGVEFSEKVQGEKNLIAMLEEKQALTKYLYDKFKAEQDDETI